MYVLCKEQEVGSSDLIRCTDIFVVQYLHAAIDRVHSGGASDKEQNERRAWNNQGTAPVRILADGSGRCHGHVLVPCRGQGFLPPPMAFYTELGRLSPMNLVKCLFQGGPTNGLISAAYRRAAGTAGRRHTSAAALISADR